MSQPRQFEGPDAEALVAEIRRELGPEAKIVGGETVRSGGVLGFFAREHYRLLAEPASPAAPDPAAAQPNASRPAPVPGSRRAPVPADIFAALAEGTDDTNEVSSLAATLGSGSRPAPGSPAATAAALASALAADQERPMVIPQVGPVTADDFSAVLAEVSKILEDYPETNAPAVVAPRRPRRPVRRFVAVDKAPLADDQPAEEQPADDQPADASHAEGAATETVPAGGDGAPAPSGGSRVGPPPWAVPAPPPPPAAHEVAAPGSSGASDDVGDAWAALDLATSGLLDDEAADLGDEPPDEPRLPRALGRKLRSRALAPRQEAGRLASSLVADAAAAAAANAAAESVVAAAAAATGGGPAPLAPSTRLLADLLADARQASEALVPDEVHASEVAEAPSAVPVPGPVAGASAMPAPIDVVLRAPGAGGVEHATTTVVATTVSAPPERLSPGSSGWSGARARDGDAPRSVPASVHHVILARALRATGVRAGDAAGAADLVGDGADLSMALTELFTKLAPAPPPIRPEPGRPVVVIGLGAHSRKVAGELAWECGIALDAVGDSGDGGATGGSDSAMALRDLPEIIALDAPLAVRPRPGDPCPLDPYRPATVVGVVDASTKPEDVMAWAARLGGLDALALHNVEATLSPAAMLAAGIPVARLDDRPASPARWAATVAELVGSL